MDDLKKQLSSAIAQNTNDTVIDDFFKPPVEIKKKEESLEAMPQKLESSSVTGQST